jgi:hypothetical protein
MDDIESSILAAWNRIGPSLHRNRDELRKRIARFRAASHPPRAWCLAIRASDTRLPVSILPDSLRQNPDGTFPHFPLTLTREDLRRLCVPIQLGEGKRSVCDVAAKLGVTRGGLLPARVKNLFDTEYLRGRHGKPRPLLHTSLPLDPATRGFVAADPVWSWTARRLPARLPPDFPDQTLLRIPHFVTRNPIHPHLNDLHPEHPLLDPPPRKRRSLALPPPPPDFVWYKWKDGQYVGHDWRNPFAVAGHQRHQRQLELARAARKKRAPTRATTPKDSLVFRGWRWICPRCQKPVNVLFLPVPPINLLKGQLLGVSGQLSVVSGQLPVVNGQLSVVSGQLPGEQTGKSASPLPPVSTSPLPPVPSSPLPLVSSSPLLPISSSPPRGQLLVASWRKLFADCCLSCVWLLIEGRGRWVQFYPTRGLQTSPHCFADPYRQNELHPFIRMDCCMENGEVKSGLRERRIRHWVPTLKGKSHQVLRIKLDDLVHRVFQGSHCPLLQSGNGVIVSEPAPVL